MKKKNIGLLTLVIILILLVLGLTGYIVYDKVFKKDNCTTNNDINKIITSDVNEEKLPKWAEYLLSNNILEVNIRRMDLNNNYSLFKIANITIEDLKTILNNLKDKNIYKTYYYDDADSLTAKSESVEETLTVKYEYNENVYEFRILDGDIYIYDIDDNFKAVLNDCNFEEKNIEDKNKEGAFYFYTIDDYSNSVLDSYFE